MLNKIIRKGSFDAGHRVMFQRFKCANIHGHRYEYELEFSYEQMQELGFAIDFSEIKRIACVWIDNHLDHSFIANPLDSEIIQLCEKLPSKCYKMHLIDSLGSCNPTVENIAKELFFVVSELMNSQLIRLDKIILHETENCIGVCAGLTQTEIKIFKNNNDFITSILNFKKNSGELEYDIRKV